MFREYDFFKSLRVKSSSFWKMLSRKWCGRTLMGVLSTLMTYKIQSWIEVGILNFDRQTWQHSYQSALLLKTVKTSQVANIVELNIRIYLESPFLMAFVVTLTRLDSMSIQKWIVRIEWEHVSDLSILSCKTLLVKTNSPDGRQVISD